MSFVITSIDPKLFAEIYTPAMAQELDEHIFYPQDGLEELVGKRWAVDEERRACLFWVHLPDRIGRQQSYVFAWNHKVALIREFENCRYSIVYASPGLTERMDAARNMMREAILIGGHLLDGLSGESETESSRASLNAELADH